ncbi:MAG: alpha/beta fold hydrolase [Acidimicrobiales bacterium]
MTFRARASGPEGGRPVLLLHGFPQTSWSWHSQLEALGAANMRAFAFDQRGYSPGARPPRVEDYVIDELVADALAVAAEQGFERFDLVGHDWGAMVAWVLAGKHPDRVRSLTAVSVPHPGAFGAALSGGDTDQVSRSSYIEVFRAEGGVAERALLGEDGSGDGLRAMFAASGMPADRPEVEEFVTAMLEPGALTAALNWYRAMQPGLADIGPTTVPTLYVWSTEDVALGRRAAEDTVNWVEGPYRFETIPDVSHWIPEMAPGELNRLLLEHLATA